MSADKKPRADSKLKTLPEERQAVIAEYALGHSLAETVAWLREDGLVTSGAALSEFLSWHRLSHQLKRNESTVAQLLSHLRQERGMSDEELQKAGQAFFSALAIEQQDSKAWFLSQQTALKKEQLNLDRQKFQRETCSLFLKWSEDRKAREIAVSGATQTEKIERLGQLMFGEDWK